MWEGGGLFVDCRFGQKISVECRKTPKNIVELQKVRVFVDVEFLGK